MGAHSILMGYNVGMDVGWRHGALRPARDRAVLVLRLAVLLAPGVHALVVLFSLIWLTLFTQVITNISYVLGPVAQFHENSRFYSAVPPKPNPEVDNRLPHITIQMPVYKESLKETMCVFFPFLYFLSFLSWGYSCYQRGFGRAPGSAALAFMLTTAGIPARRDLRGIAVSPLGLGRRDRDCGFTRVLERGWAYRDEMFRCGLVSFLVASGVGWNADARWRWRLDGDA